MTISLSSLSKKILLLGFSLYALQGIFFLMQAMALGRVIVGPKPVKVVIFIIFSLALLLKAKSVKKVDHNSFFILSIFVVFLCFNFFMIQVSDEGGQPLMAFAYNYSLSIILFPLGILYLNGRGAIDVHNRGTRLWMFVILFFITIAAVYEIVMQQSIFQTSKEILAVNEIIKFGQINGFNRINSIFKSPIDYSYINAAFASLFLYFYLKYKNYRYLFLVVVMSVIELLILVRSGLVMMSVAYLVILMSHFSTSRFYLYVFITAPVLLGGFVFLYLNYSVVFDPTNLYIRFSEWGNLISSIDKVSELVFGKGVVQNGSFGDKHAIVIDNLYVGILYAGGLVSLTLFSIFITLLIVKLYSKKDGINSWMLGVLLGVLAAGVFENVMHLFYLALIPFFFSLESLTKSEADRKEYADKCNIV